MFNKKFLIFVILLTLVFSVGYSQDSLYKSPKKLYVITTKYFDIIFPQESTESANLLAQKADNMYLEICEKLDSSPYFRIPVVITPEKDTLNAYYTSFPYNRIVLYDTLPTTSALSVFSETFVNVFYHELVHAVSLQKKNSFFKFLSSVFGDSVSTSQVVTLPTSFIEGVTVSFESAKNEGRLNDSFSTHIITQAKLENKFPTWKEATGARDIYPTGSLPYVFGGAFHYYIQNRFGMEKYVEFWEKANASVLSEALIFKKVYGYKLNEIWSDFENSISVPKINDVNSVSIDKSKKNIGRYFYLCSDDKNFYWYDKSKSSIFYSAYENFNSEKNFYQTKKLVRLDGSLTSMSLSSDSKYLVISQVDANSEKNFARLFNLQTKKLENQKFKNLRESCLVKLQDGIEYLAGIKTDSSKNYFIFYDLVTGQEKFCKEFNLHTQAFYPVDVKNGIVAYLKKEKMNWSIEVYNPILEKTFQFDLPKELIFNSLTPTFTENSVRLNFSCANKIPDGTLPRLGFVEFSSKEIFENLCQSKTDFSYSVTFQKDDISGGIYFPFVIDNKVFCASKYFNFDKLQQFSLSDIETETFVFNKSQNQNEFENQIENKTKTEVILPKENLFETKNYRGINYLTKGFFVPVSIMSVDRLSTTKLNSLSDIGFTYITGEPTEQWIYILSPFVNIFSKEAGYFIEVENFTFPVSLIFDTDFSSKFDLSKWKINNLLTANYNLYLGSSTRYFNFLNETGFNLNFKSKLDFQFNDYFQIMYTDYFNDGLGSVSNNLLGYQLGVGFDFDLQWTKNIDELKNINLFSYLLNLYFPILGTSQDLNFIYNLPTQLKLVFFPTNEEFCSFSTETTLFGIEIQKSISFLPMYLSRFLINAGYDSVYPTISTVDSRHQLFTKFKMIFSPIYGSLSKIQLNLGLDIYYQIDEDKFSFSLGGILDL
ncbi:MAG: hypothetical protein UH788_04910 [Treponemataceae bacterium]|nr:hypothetical protein [Treponemataceae bacterium]